MAAAGSTGGFVVGDVFILVVVVVHNTGMALVLVGRNPAVVVHWAVLIGEVDARAGTGGAAAGTVGTGSTHREAGANSGFRFNPVGKGVFAILDDAAT